MSKVARQHWQVMKVLRTEQIRAEKRRRGGRKRTRYCKECGDKTENGCFLCSAFLCNPYINDCFEVHARSMHRKVIHEGHRSGAGAA